jgi:hypothetical protein
VQAASAYQCPSMVNMKMIFFFGELARQKELIYIPCPCIAISHMRARRHEHLGY